MSNIEYQKIELHSTDNLGKDHERIEYERETAQRLMMENQIQFAIEIDEVDIKNSSNNKTGTAYVLNLIVRKDDVQKVIELLDREGGFGYYVDLDETFDPMAEEKEEEEQEGAFVEIPEELREETKETENNDPIKIYGEENGNITIEFKTPEIQDLANFMMKACLIISTLVIAVLEFWLLINFLETKDFEGVCSIIVALILETPLVIWLYDLLNKKKGE